MQNSGNKLQQKVVKTALEYPMACHGDEWRNSYTWRFLCEIFSARTDGAHFPNARLWTYLKNLIMNPVGYGPSGEVKMAYDEEIDARIKKVVSRWKGASYKKMFGGVCHLLNGNMIGGVHKDKLILRLSEKESGKALQKEYAIPFDITGKPMKGWIMVEKEGFKTDEELRALLNLTRKFSKKLPPK